MYYLVDMTTYTIPFADTDPNIVADVAFQLYEAYHVLPVSGVYGAGIYLTEEERKLLFINISGLEMPANWNIIEQSNALMYCFSCLYLNVEGTYSAQYYPEHPSKLPPSGYKRLECVYNN